MGQSSSSSSYIYLALIAFIVFRYAVRELRPRVITMRIWIAPAIFVALLLFTLYGVFEIAPDTLTAAAEWIVGGLIVGAIAGALIVRNTAIRPGPRTGTVIAQGNWTTLVIWLVAIALRFVVRFFATGHLFTGFSSASQLAPNAGMICVVLAAFVVIAATFSKAARAHVMPNSRP